MPDLTALREALDRTMDLRFPGKCSGRNLYGIELALLDADIHEAVKKIANGNRDPEVLNRLGSLELHARMVLHGLENDAHFFYHQYRELARMALDLVSVERGPVVRLVEAVIADDSPDPDMLMSCADVINECAFGYDTALTTAARLGREGWCRTLLDAGADPALEYGSLWTPLDLAAVSGQVAILRVLLEAGVDPNRVYYSGNPPTWMSPLLWAIDYEHEEAVMFLLEHGADPWVKNYSGIDIYDNAIKRKETGIAGCIAKACEQSREQKESS